MAKKMWVPFIVYFTLFSWISADENTHFKVISDGNPAILNCTFSEYAPTIKIVTVDFNSTVCNNSDEDILKEVSNLCHNNFKCEFELADLIKDHNSTCSSNESTAQLGITYHCSYTRFKVISDGGLAFLNCTSAEYAATIKIVTVDFNSTVCNDSDEDILKEVSNLCHNNVKCEFELSDLIKDHNSTCSSNESTAQLGITYHCSYPFTMQYSEGDSAMLTCTGEYNETIHISSVLYNYSTCSHGDKYGIQNLCDDHATCSFDVTNSNVGSSCGADGKASLQVSYNCKRNGGWSNWTMKSDCSVTCGGGIQSKTRKCTNPSPNEIGMSCVGDSHYAEVCNENICSHDDHACLDIKLNWTCPGGYIKMNGAIWKTIDNCGRRFTTSSFHSVSMDMQNKCDNKTTCVFTVEDSIFDVPCIECSRLDYSYTCVEAPWNSWELWSNCSGSCVTGIQTRTRSCNSGFETVECEGSSTESRDCNETDCSYCSDQKFYHRQDSSLPLKTDSSAGTGYLLIDPVNTVHCCGQITMWHYIPIKTGTVTFSVWRKTHTNRYKVIGTNTVVVKATDANKQTAYNVPDNERILINTGDIIGWHDGGQNIIGYYECRASKKPCPAMILRNSMGSTNTGDEINVESLPQQSSRIYTMSYTSTVKGPPTFNMTPDSVTIGDHKSVNSRVMDIQITDFGDFVKKMELDYDNEYFYFDTRLRSVIVKKMLPQKRTTHNYVLSVQDWCSNTATLNVTIVTENTPPMIHGLPDMLRINPNNIDPNLTTFSVDDPSDNVTCMINKTSPHTDMFILSLHGNDAALILSENSSIDVNTTSEYVINISCTDGTDTTFVDLKLLFTTKDPALTDKPDPVVTDKPDPDVTDKPDMQSDTIPIIIGASIGGLFIILIVVIIVVCARKKQHKKKDENKAYEKPLQLSNIDGSSGGATPNQYSRAKEVDAIPHDNNGYVDVDLAKMKARNDEKQPKTSVGCEYQTPWR